MIDRIKGAQQDLQISESSKPSEAESSGVIEPPDKLGGTNS
jgi:hypothetical protein